MTKIRRERVHDERAVLRDGLADGSPSKKRQLAFRFAIDQRRIPSV